MSIKFFGQTLLWVVKMIDSTHNKEEAAQCSLG